MLWLRQLLGDAAADGDGSAGGGGEGDYRRRVCLGSGVFVLDGPLDVCRRVDVRGKRDAVVMGRCYSCVCVHVCMHTNIHAYIYTCIQAYIQARCEGNAMLLQSAVTCASIA